MTVRHPAKRGDANPKIEAESDSGVAPVDTSFPVFDIRRYGAACDGVTDDYVAIEKAQQVVVANNGGPIIIPYGCSTVCGTALPEISLRTSDNGGYSAPCTQSVQVVALGATISFTGSGSMFNIQGTTVSTTAPRRFDLIGGSFIGTSSGEGVLKIRDGNRASVHPEYIGDFSAGRALWFQNAHSWSENVTVCGPNGSVATFIGNLIDIHMQGNTAAEVEEGSLGAGTESFARFQLYNTQHGSIQTSPNNALIVKVEGSWYDGKSWSVRGNQSNGVTSKLIDIQGGMTRTVISDWKFEGANVDNKITMTAVAVEGFAVKDTITGGTSGATAIIRRITGASPTFTFEYSDTSGTFQTAAETITSSGTGTATKDGNAPTAVADAAMFDGTGSGESDQARPRVVDCDWTGGDAVVLAGWGDSVENSAYIHHTNVAFEAVTSYDGAINPSLTQSENNWAPTGIGTCTHIILGSDGAYNLTGITEGFEGRVLPVINRSGQLITLVDSSGSSTGANRFLLGADLILPDNAGCLLIYDTSGADRWLCLGVFYGDNGLYSSGSTGGSASAGAGNQYVELSIGGTIYKVLHDGTV